MAGQDHPGALLSPRRKGRLWLWLAPAPLFLLVLAMALWYRASARSDASQTYEGTELQGAAPDFRLVDQNSLGVALSDFRGRVVVLAFLDPKCTDVCPLTALHFRQTRLALGKDAAQVAFLAINVNTEVASVADAAAATKRWGMDQVQAWHFLTGRAEELQAVWKAYAIFAGDPKPGKPGEVQHAPGVFVIDQAGVRRWYISVPLDQTGWRGPTLSDVLQTRLGQLLKAPGVS